MKYCKIFFLIVFLLLFAVSGSNAGHEFLATRGTETITTPMAAGGWSLGTDGTGGWGIAAGVLSKTASAGTQVATAGSGQTAPVVGTTYEVIFSVDAISGAFQPSLGGVSMTSFNVTGTITRVCPKALTTDKLSITGLASATCTITVISVKPYVDGTGDSTVEGNLTIKSPMLGPAGNDVLVPIPSGGASLPAMRLTSGTPAVGQLFVNSDTSGTIGRIGSVGTAGQVLTSNGAGALPSFQNSSGGSANDLLSGMWSKSVDNDTIQVQPGSIEIGGQVYTQSTAANVTLSGNLRGGETEGSSKYYYLYAIAGLPLTYKFSETAPGLDRFNNVVTFDRNLDFTASLFHPTEGLTWRFIGQVYNDGSSNIMAYDKCKPGYWESPWIAIPGTYFQNIPHALGMIPVDLTYLFKFNLADTSWENFTFSYWEPQGGGTYGVVPNFTGYSTTTTIRTLFGTSGIFHDGVGWRTTGYYKLIVR